jgi:hypothetical protein
MANDYLIPSVIPATSPVTPATPPVIPAKAGIQPHYEEQRLFSAALDTRLRGYDGIDGGTGSVDSAQAGGLGHKR